MAETDSASISAIRSTQSPSTTRQPGVSPTLVYFFADGFRPNVPGLVLRNGESSRLLSVTI